MIISIRDETPSDHDATRRVTTDAFANSEFGHNGEAELVDLLREHCERTVSLVACSEDAIVGHILFTPVVIRADNHELHGMGIAPMSVAPEFQNTGIGSLLVNSGLERLGSDDCPFVVVLGHPDYYPRFGFLPASQHSISHGFAGIPQDVFFIKSLAPNVLQFASRGAAYYRAEFGPQHTG